MLGGVGVARAPSKRDPPASHEGRGLAAALHRFLSGEPDATTERAEPHGGENEHAVLLHERGRDGDGEYAENGVGVEQRGPQPPHEGLEFLPGSDDELDRAARELALANVPRHLPQKLAMRALPLHHGVACRGTEVHHAVAKGRVLECLVSEPLLRLAAHRLVLEGAERHRAILRRDGNRLLLLCHPIKACYVEQRADEEGAPHPLDGRGGEEH
mmetsp:Transcript_66383/g.210008  ORF Transcript_66383/g.210008 Transcript_66383/m.210008 type:complete len:214 (+) Transcript_66383:500-1141(+)